MKIIVTGSTGLVGSEVIRQAISDKEISQINAITRKDIGILSPKLKQIHHENYNDYTDLKDLIINNDAILWCLGISQTQVSKDEYVKITYDYTLAAANLIKTVNPNMIFIFVSGMGADSTEQSKAIFARVKGMTENALLKIGLQNLIIVRPGGIKPITKNQNTAFSNKIMIPFFPVLELFAPNTVISSVDLAKVILKLAKKGYHKTIIENAELKSLIIKRM